MTAHLAKLLAKPKPAAEARPALRIYRVDPVPASLDRLAAMVASTDRLGDAVEITTDKMGWEETVRPAKARLLTSAGHLGPGVYRRYLEAVAELERRRLFERKLMAAFFVRLYGPPRRGRR